MANSDGSSDQRSEGDGFTVPLCLWQRATFLSATPGHGGESCSSSRSKARETDSLRLRIAQLNHEYWREISRGFQPLHVEKLTHSLTETYCTAMDTSEGVETIEGPVKVLTAGRKKESRLWKSEMSVESVLAMPGVIATDRDQRVESLPVECVSVTSVSHDTRRNGSQRQENTNSTTTSFLHSRSPTAASIQSTLPQEKLPQPQPQLKRQHQQSLVQPPLISGNKTMAVGQFPYSGGPSSSRVIGNDRRDRKKEEDEEEEEEEEEEQTNGKQYGGRRGGYRGRRRKVVRGGWQARKKAKREEEDEDEELEETAGSRQTLFITAKDQHMLNVHKKYGGKVATENGPQANSYGCSKKSLGTRRVPGSKFVPPVRREEGEGGGSGEGASSFVDTVRSKVQYGGGRGGGGGGGGGGDNLPPELMGDERLKNIEPRMVELIMNEIMDHGAPVQWDDIAGLQFAKATIKEIVVWPMLRPDIFTGLRGPPKGILLFGPPGTGKTLIGKCIASQVNATFFSISASCLTSKWIGEGEKMVRALFAVARCYQPAVIFMDEIDSLLSQRSESEHESSRRIKTEFLVQLDGATTSADDRILIIGATNRPQEIDEAARRRLVKRLYIPLPDGMARKQIVNNLLREQAYSLTDEELEKLSETTDGYSGADMANLCREAAYGPIREAAETIQHISADEMRPVMFVDFQAALNVIRPSVSESDLDLYIQWNRQFGCGKQS